MKVWRSFRVPESVVSGTQLENVVFEIVNTEGGTDDTFHDDAEKCQSHLLELRTESSMTDESIRYTFKRCTVPAILISQKGGTFSFVACHSRYQDLRQFVEVRTFSKIPFLTITLHDHDFLILFAGSCSASSQTGVLWVSTFEFQQ